MARIIITIDIPPDGPTQVSITTDDQFAARPAARAPASNPNTGITQVKTGAPNGSALRATRAARGWSQRELAERIGCSPNTVALIERGKMSLSDKMRGRIQKAGVVLMGSNGDGAGGTG